MIPGADRASMTEGSAGELQRERSWISACTDIIPVEDVLTQASVPARIWHRKRHTAEAFRGWVRVGIERRFVVPRIAGPPAHDHLLRIHSVAHDEITRWRFGWQAGKEVYREIKRTPPRIDRR